MALTKLRLIFILALVVIVTSAPAGFGQVMYYDPFARPVIPLPLIPFWGYGIGTTAFAVEDIREVQIALRNRGFYFGDFNGMLSLETVDAVRRFQAANNLEATGILDARTQMALGALINGTATTTAAYSYFDLSTQNAQMHAFVEQELRTREVTGEAEQELPETVPPMPVQTLHRMTYPSAVAVILSDENLMAIERALKERGFDPGPGRGMDARWVDAIRRFQAEHNIPVTGYLDEATLHALDLRFEIHEPRPGTMRVWRSGRYPAGAPESTPGNNPR